MTLTGVLKLPAKSNPTHPGPRFRGSCAGCPWMTGPGKPSVTLSKRQSEVISRTRSIIFSGVIFFPEENLRGTFLPERRNLIEEPPISITRIFMGILFKELPEQPDEQANDCGKPDQVQEQMGNCK